MYPPVTQFSTRQMELEAELGLYGERGAAAQRRLESARAERKIAELRLIPLFAALPPDRFELLACTTNVAEVRAGTELISEGTVGREFFAISEGTVEVSQDGKPIAVERTGDFFGEIALLHGILRTATVKTTSRSRLFVMNSRDFRRVLEPSFA